MTALAPPANTLAEHWSALATVALLGSDRRPLPPAPTGPLEDLVIDRADHAASELLLDEVSMLSALRRAGLQPNAAAPMLVPCPPDDRPECSPAAVERLRLLLAEWPHLLDEWLAGVARAGWQLPADVSVLLLRSLRNDARRRAVIAAVAGPVSDWLVALFPDELAPRPTRKQATSAAAAEVAEPPLPKEIADLAALAPADLAAALSMGLAQARLVNRHRNALIRLVSSLPVTHLGPLAEALTRSATHPDTMGLALTLADLARFRWDLNKELQQ